MNRHSAARRAPSPAPVVLLLLAIAATIIAAVGSVDAERITHQQSGAQAGSGAVLQPARAAVISPNQAMAAGSSSRPDDSGSSPPMDPAESSGNDPTTTEDAGSDEEEDSSSQSDSASADGKIGKNLFKGKITVVKNDNFLVSNLKMQEDQSLKQEERVKRVEMQRERIRLAEEKLRRTEAEDRERAKREDAAEQAGKQSRQQELEAQKKREQEDEERSKEEKRKALFAEQQKLLQQQQQAQRQRNAEQLAAERAKLKTACRKKIGSPSAQAGQFTWPVYRYSLGPFPPFAGDWSFDARGTLVGDFNGDGKDDYARVGPTYIRFFISKGDGNYFQPVYSFPSGWDFGTDENSWTTLKTIDLNGDKRADIVRLHRNYNHAFLSRGGSNCFERDGEVDRSCFTVTAYRFRSGFSFTGDWNFNHPATVQGDFNGDGKGDYARLGPTYIHFFISKGDGQFFMPVYRFKDNWNFGTDENGWTSAVGDYNADCKTDIMRTSGRYHHGFFSTDEDDSKCWLHNGDSPAECFKVTTYWYPNGWNFQGVWAWTSRAFIQGDFNGDHRTDFARLGGQYIHFFISQGSGQFSYPIYPFPAGWNFGFDEAVWTSLPAGDFDGDGKADIIRTYHTYNHGFFSRGTDEACWAKNGWIDRSCMLVTAFRYPGGWHFSGGWKWDSLATVVADFNGDGRSDYANLRGPHYNHQFFAR